MTLLTHSGISFRSLCEDSSPFVLCNLFSNDLHQTCVLSGVGFGIIWLQDFVDMLICILAITGLVFVFYKTYRRKAAVGRIEMYTLHSTYIAILLLQIAADGGWIGPDIPSGFLSFRKWVSIFHASLVTAAYWILFINGLIVHQFIEDGSRRSLSILSIGAFFISLITFYVAADSSFQWSGKFPLDSESLGSWGLLILSFVVPALFTIAYVISQCVLIFLNLSARKPLGFLFLGLGLFIISQFFLFYISPHLCIGSNGFFDGRAFGTLFCIFAYISFFFYWMSITEDNWEELNDTV